MSNSTDLVGAVLALPEGAPFTVNGRTYSRHHGQVDGYADRLVIRAWNAAGRIVRVTLRDSSRIVIG